MSSSISNVGLARLPWGRLPRSPVAGGPSPLEISFRDIMAEQLKENGQDKAFEEYVQSSYVTVGSGERQSNTPSPSLSKDEGIKDIPEVEKSFLQLEDLDTDFKMVMSFYEDQDFDDAAYELSEQELDELPDDDTSKYYEGLAKKLSTVVEIQSSPLSSITSSSSNRGNRSSNSSSLPATDLDSLDSQTKVMLNKLKQKGVLRSELSPSSYKPVHVGKCATIFHTTGGMLKRREDAALVNSTSSLTTSVLKLRLPKECAIKVFRNDPDNWDSLRDDKELDEDERHVEAKREMAHLNRMTRAGVSCAQVKFLYGHILITEFLGKDGIAAKKLKDANELTNNRSSLKMAYDQVTNDMKTLFKTCQLVHGNLSGETILWYKRQAYITSVGEAVNANRPSALELLYRDCSTITEFFEKKGKPGCQTSQQLFHWITGFDYTGQLKLESCGEDFAIV